MSNVASLRETIAFLRDPAAFMAGQGLERGDLYRVRIPGRRLYVVTDPDTVERILVSESASFSKSRVYWRELRRSVGDCMGSLDGERWEYLHRLQRPFFTPKAVQGHLAAVERLTTLQLRTLAEHLDEAGEVSVLDVFSELNARIVLSVLFEDDDAPAAPEIARRIADGHAILAWRTKFPWRPLLGRFTAIDRRGEEHKRFFGAYADRLRRSAAPSDASTLLRALRRAANDATAPPLPEMLLRNELTFHLGASTETQAAVEGWTVYLLSRHPDVLERVRCEISRAAGEAVVSFEHLPRLHYARQVLQEALRLYPPVHAVVRDCATPVELKGHSARKGEVFLISLYGLHRSPRLWDDPSAFRPERFRPDGARAIGKYQYLPFGAGKHACIGQHLSLPCMLLAVAQFVQRFEWTFRNLDVRPVALPSLKPGGAFTITLTRRL